MRTKIAVGIVLAVLGQTGLASAQEDPQTDGLVQLAGRRIEQFWNEYSQVTSTEDLRQVKLTPEGERVAESRSVFDYLMVMEISGNRPRFEESRIQRTASPDSGATMLTTSGFPALLLILHPYFHESFVFTRREEAIAGSIRQIDFQAVPGRDSPSVLRLGGRQYPILWRGTIWVEETTGMVTRIEAHLGESMADLGLESMDAETNYHTVTMEPEGPEYWLPESATIEVRSEHQRWRNEHKFTDYRMFSVESELEIPDLDGKNQ